MGSGHLLERGVPAARGSRLAFRFGLLALIAACGDAGGPEVPAPPAVAKQISVGDTVSGAMEDGDTLRWFKFSAPQAGLYAVFAQLKESSRWVTFSGELPGKPPTSVFAFGGLVAGPLLAARSGIFTLPKGREVFVKVYNRTPFAKEFRLLVTPVSAKPEFIPATVSIDKPYSTETLETTADIDSLSFWAIAGDLLVLYLQPHDATRPPGLFRGVVRDPGEYYPLAVLQSANPPDTLTSNASYRFNIPHTGRFDLVFDASRAEVPAGSEVPGGYSFELRHIDTLPEGSLSVIPRGDTIGSTLDYVGDVDRFSFNPDSGEYLVLFAEDDAAPGGDLLGVTVTSSEGTYGGVAPVPGPVGMLLQPALRIHPVSNRPLRVEVSSYGGQALGPYRLLLTGIDPAPEIASGAPAAGQIVEDETIGIPGDFDEFKFSGVAGGLATLFVEASGSSPDEVIWATLTDSARNPLARTVDSTGGWTLLQTSPGTYTLPYTGTYILQVDGTTTHLDEPYRALFTRIDPGPEHVPAIITVNDTVVGETLDPGDIDEFYVHLTAGDTVDLGLDSDPPGSDFRVDITFSLDSAPSASASRPGVLPSPGSWRASSSRGQHVIVPITGDYRIWIRGILDAGQVGPYRIWVTD